MIPRLRILLALLLLSLPLRAQNLAPEQMKAVSYEQKIGAQLPLNLPFTDEAGQSAPLAHWLGTRPTVLVFDYHDCPSLCSVVLGSLVESLRNMRAQVGRDFDVTVVSIDPRETPVQAEIGKRRYSQRYGHYGSEGGWHFLTGSADSIAGLAGAAGFHYVHDPQSGQYAHAAGIAVVTPGGKVSRYFLGVEFPPRELQSALAAAGHETIGQRMQNLLLLCFHYSPITGRYGSTIQFAIRAAGLGTVAALILGILILNRRRRTA